MSRSAPVDVSLKLQFHWVPTNGCQMLYSIQEQTYIAKVTRKSYEIFQVLSGTCTSVDDGCKAVERFLISQGGIQHAMQRYEV